MNGFVYVFEATLVIFAMLLGIGLGRMWERDVQEERRVAAESRTERKTAGYFGMGS